MLYLSREKQMRSHATSLTRLDDMSTNHVEEEEGQILTKIPQLKILVGVTIGPGGQWARSYRVVPPASLLSQNRVSRVSITPHAARRSRT